MRILVTGSRDWTDKNQIYWELEEARDDVPHSKIMLVHGACPTGADKIAEHYAKVMGWGIDPHPAKWSNPCGPSCSPWHRRERLDGSTYCPVAGLRRNVEMVNSVVAVRHLEPVICLAFIKDYSPGSTQCATYAGSMGLEVRIFHA